MQAPTGSGRAIGASPIQSSASRAAGWGSTRAVTRVCAPASRDQSFDVSGYRSGSSSELSERSTSRSGQYRSRHL